jgi:hypothetical protein
MLLFPTAFSPTLGPTKRHIRWILGGYFAGVKWLGCDTEYLFQSNIEVMSGGTILPVPYAASWSGA